MSNKVNVTVKVGKIKQCTNGGLWYKEKIGTEFFVVPTGNDYKAVSIVNSSNKGIRQVVESFGLIFKADFQATGAFTLENVEVL